MNDLDRYVARLMRTDRIPGLSLGIAKDGKPTVLRGYGFRDREADLPATPRTVYGLASITKSFTALATLQLEERGRLRVTDRVTRHLPEFRTPDPRWGSRITLRHLLSHSSGIPAIPATRYAYARNYAREPASEARRERRLGIDPHHAPLDSYEQVLEYLATERYRLLGPPGRYFSYSNIGFALLGAVIERASGRTYETYVGEEVLAPAGMTRTTFDPGVMFRFPEVTTLYTKSRAGGRLRLVPSQEWMEAASARPGGGLRSNVEDMLRYLEIYRTGGRVGRERIVSRSSVKKMLRPAIAMPGGFRYGYGVAMKPDYHGHLVAQHGGGHKGISAEIVVVPDTGVTGVVLTNVEGVSAYRALYAGINPLLGLPMQEDIFRPLPPSEPPRSFREFSGWYCAGVGMWVRIIAGRRDLTADLLTTDGNEKGIKLTPNGGDDFVLRWGRDQWTVRFYRGAGRRVKGLWAAYTCFRRSSAEELRRAGRGHIVW